MSDVIKLRTIGEIEDEAAAWVWRLDGRSLTAPEQREFDAWLKRDPRHRHAFDELGGVWAALDELEEAKRDEKIATFSTPVPVSVPRARTYQWAAGLAAAVLLAFGVQLWLQRGLEEQSVATAIGQQRTLALADGSVVNLNTNTILETHFLRHSREVRLVKGEAHFVVAKDADRPFRVHAGETVVRAVGTQFAVRMTEMDDVEVVVAEGRVEVTATPEPGAQPRAKVEDGLSVPVREPAVVPLTAGHWLESDGAAVRVAAIDSDRLAKTLAWREGAVIFDGEPLSRAVETLNRYTEQRLVVVDPVVADMRVGGRFRTNDIERFLSALQVALPVSVRRTDNDIVYIEQRR